MTDLYFSQSGDIRVSSNGDIGVTETPWREDAQNAYIRLMTSVGDFLLYPTLGCLLDKLNGMPQSRKTGDYGVSLIMDALNGDRFFAGKAFEVRAVPTGPQTLRFDVTIFSGDRASKLLSIEKDLGIG